MQVVGLDARLLRDGAGNNHVLQDQLGDARRRPVGRRDPRHPGVARAPTSSTRPTSHQLTNDAENFGGMMTEIRVN